MLNLRLFQVFFFFLYNLFSPFLSLSVSLSLQAIFIKYLHLVNRELDF